MLIYITIEREFDLILGSQIGALSSQSHKQAVRLVHIRISSNNCQNRFVYITRHYYSVFQVQWIVRRVHQPCLFCSRMCTVLEMCGHTLGVEWSIAQQRPPVRPVLPTELETQSIERVESNPWSHWSN